MSRLTLPHDFNGLAAAAYARVRLTDEIPLGGCRELSLASKHHEADNGTRIEVDMSHYSTCSIVTFRLSRS
jgi:hypothetical protein